MTNYWIGALTNHSPHFLSVHYVGEWVDEDENQVKLRNLFRMIEVQDHSGRPMLTQVNDPFFNSSAITEVNKKLFMVSRILDPEIDRDLIRKFDDFQNQIRHQKLNLVTPNQRILTETNHGK